MNWGWSACFCLLLLVRLPASLTDFSRAAAGARQAAVRTDSAHSHPLLSSSENFKQKTPLLPENVSFSFETAPGRWPQEAGICHRGCKL